MIVHAYPWRAEWRGGRLADVYHAQAEDAAVDCVQVGAYDWQRGRLVAEPTPASLEARLREWVAEQGETIEREVLPYMHP